MKYIFFSISLTFTVQAGVIELGTIDSRKQQLDQRFTYSITESERLNALGNYYHSKELDFVSGINEVPGPEIQNPDDGWKNLIEGEL